MADLAGVRLLPNVAAAAAVVAAALGAGRLLVRRPSESAEAALLAVAAGLGLLPLAVAAAGCLDLLRPAAAVLLVGAGIAAAVRPGVDLIGRARRTAAPRPTAVGLLLAAAGGAAVSLALLPPTDRDAAVYHIGLANEWVVAGRIFHAPGTIYAGFPQGATALYALCLLLAGGTAAKIVSVAHGLVAALAAAALARRLDARAGAWAAALLALSPAFLFLSNFCGADLVLAAHAACALLALARGETALAGLLAGFGAAARYQGFPAAAGVAVAAAALRGPRAGGAVLGLALLPPLPWLAKNLVATGNPLFPIGSLDERTASIVALDLGRYAHPLSWTSVVALPWAMVARPYTFETPFGAASLAALIAGLLLGLRGAPRGREGLPRALAAAGLVHVAVWAASVHVSRFLLPALAAVAPVAAAALAPAPGGRGRFLRAIALLALVWQAGTAARLTAVHFRPQAVWSGRLTRAAFVERERPLARLLPAARTLPADARVLFVGEVERWPFPRPLVAGSPYDEQPIAAYLGAAADAPDLIRRLEADGITHVVVNEAGLADARRFGVLPFDGRTAALLDDLVARGLRPVAVRPPVGLFALRQPDERGRIED